MGLSAEYKFIFINSVIKKYKLKNMISYLCKIASVSRSGYYNYFSLKSKKIREQRDKRDYEIKEIVLKAYNFKGRKVDLRQSLHKAEIVEVLEL